ncbi:tetratricopeptide repeat protein, partial [Actinoplanes xinjiangensis]|uniref:tetratricopeptide repeat protein n=1 Tax=Actinoplanes xinjiangensis TaxID=512350 RepID=UPI003425C384
MAGGNININYGDAPAFAVQEFVAPAPAGLAELTRVRQQPSMLLTAQRQAIPFTGRTAEMTELRQWQDAAATRSVWAWHGPGGQGKTRLAQQVGRQSTASGWRVGVVSHRDAAPGDVDARPLVQPWRWLPASRRPLLLLVDYAERWPLHDLLRLLADCRQRAPKVRVLLLARSVDWWPTVAAELHRLGFIAGGDTQPWPLPALAHDRPGRRRLFETACERFAQIYQSDMPAHGWPGQWKAPGDLGDDSVYGTVLGVHMAALATVDAYTRQTNPPGSAGDVSRYLLDRERSYWARLHGTAADTVRAAARTVLLACLTGPQTPDAGIRLLELTGLADRPAGQKLLDAHDRCYPPSSSNTVLEPVYPDRLAEDFIALSLPADPSGGPITRSGHTDSWAATTLVSTLRGLDDTVVFVPGPLTARAPGQKPPGHTSRILIFLAAAAGRSPHVQGWLHTLLTTDPALAVHAGGVALNSVVAYTSPSLAETIYELLPERSLDLGPAAVALARHLLDDTDNSPEQHARHCGNLAIRLAHTGRREQALTPAEEATGIYRQLADADPDAYLPHLAASLNNLSTFLSGLGRRKQAMTPAEEATGIYRRLADADPDAYLPHLAASLNNLSTFLSGLRRRDQALASAEEATGIRRRLAETQPDAYLPDLAESLNNLSNSLSELGRQDRALASAEEAVTIQRRLADAHPDAYLPDLAGSLNNLSMRLSELGRREQALAPAEEATGIRRRLADAHPDAYLPHLAASLSNLSTVLSELGRRDQALAPAEEATGIRRRLADAHPDAYLPHLAASLNNLSTVLSGLGRQDQALAAAEEATGIHHRLADAHPDPYLPDLAGSLNNLSVRLSELGRRDQALAPAEEATGIRRRLADAHPDA